MILQEKLNTSGSVGNRIAANFIDEFRDEEYRRVYTDEFLNAKIATQIKVLREQRGWTQEELAERAEMKQERVAVLENVNYESWTLNVLRRFAKAFDLRLNVSFEEFGSFLPEFANFGKASLERASFERDPVFKRKPRLVRRPLSKSYRDQGRQPLQGQLFMDYSSVLQGGDPRKESQRSSRTDRLCDFSIVGKQKSEQSHAQAMARSKQEATQNYSTTGGDMLVDLYRNLELS